MEVGNKLNRSPLDRVLGRLDDLDEVNLGILVQRLARERKLLETVFDVIRDGVLVLDDEGFLTYSNQQGRTLIGLKDNNSEKINIHNTYYVYINFENLYSKEITLYLTKLP